MRAIVRTVARSQRGMSLVEVTIILMTLSVLAAIIAPTARVSIAEGRQVKAKKDVEAIGSAIAQVLRDTGLSCLSLNGSSCANSATGRVELLVSGTGVGTNEPVVVTNALAVAANTASSTTLNWGGGTNEVVDGRRDLMSNQFAGNTPGYASPDFSVGGGPRTGVGWRGPYVNTPIDVDPWGYAYQASTVFLTVAPDVANDGTGTGQRRGGWSNDVVVVSAGSNGTVQTAFGSTATTAVGDDVVYVVQGATR